MNLEEKVMQELKTAMKAKDQASMRGLRAIKDAILKFKTSGTGEKLTDENELKLLQKLVKQRRDSLEIFEQQNREDLARIEREEIEVIERFLPKQLSEEELQSEIRQIIDEVGATSMKDMGKVMGVATKKLAGKAEGKAISETVKAILSA